MYNSQVVIDSDAGSFRECRVFEAIRYKKNFYNANTLSIINVTYAFSFIRTLPYNHFNSVSLQAAREHIVSAAILVYIIMVIKSIQTD